MAEFQLGFLPMVEMVPLIGSSSSSASTSLFAHSLPHNSKLHSLQSLFESHRYKFRPLMNGKCQSKQFSFGTYNRLGGVLNKKLIVLAASQDQSKHSELNTEVVNREAVQDTHEGSNEEGELYTDTQRSKGQVGFVSFYGIPYTRHDNTFLHTTVNKRPNVLWVLGPSVLVASLVIPSLYLRRVLSTVFEDSLLTDFLILFFTEALFYGGVAVFVLLTHHMQRPYLHSMVKYSAEITPHFGQRIFSVVTLVLSLIIPLVTMGLVWPWTGPAASATLAPYLVGLVVQFAFERYVRYTKSPAWPSIPIIFQVYRLHQLNRAAQLVTALSYSVRGAEANSQTLAINSSLGALLNVLQFLGIICIWSLASFLMRSGPCWASQPDP
ncbi:uncharacterized protein LOC18430817 [Amborella trichopoda]|nr:uncharacterized protein LOC18430817 [Amborella trichopoda]|eukprot:XP_006841021.2 uncharacterized protein LOC18430817 [Amborella trichopoda]